MSDRSFDIILNDVRMSISGGVGLRFPPVLSHAIGDESLGLVFDIQPDLDWFRGHFPGHPVLPGIVQLHWAVAVAAAYFEIPEVPAEVLRLKFKSIVVPPCTVELTLARPAPTDVQFEYTGSERQYSQGRLRFNRSSQ